MFTAGLGIPMLAALNSALGQRIGAPAAAAAVLFAVAFVCAFVAALITVPRPWPTITGHPWHLYLGGTLVAFYVLSVTWIAPRFGVGNAVFFVLMGQLVSSALIDTFGLFGALAVPLSPGRIAGLVAMAVGLGLALKG
ncbi:MAG: DMT family transporter [Rhodobacteraceae bacterium]|nr:DMT family transporter [Paracoccaceae bacterium]